MNTKHVVRSEESAAEWLRLPAVLQRYSLSRSLIYRLIAEGRLPRPHKLSARCALFNVVEYDAAFAKLLAKTDQAVHAIETHAG